MSGLLEKEVLDFIKGHKRVKYYQLTAFFRDDMGYFENDVQDVLKKLFEKKAIKLENGWCVLNK